jgi:hypothetical protein
MLRRHAGRPRLTRADRAPFAALSRAAPRTAWTKLAVKPDIQLARTASVSRRRWTGECELVDGRTVGLLSTSAPAWRAEAYPSEVLVSNTVKDLAAGSGIKFENGGKSSSRASQAEDGSTLGQLNVRS